MCILSFLPSGVMPDLEGLRNGGLNNPDGHGWAIASPEYDHILTGHSLNLIDALEEFAEYRDKYPEGPALFHSRWATHGSVSTENCHPFYVDHDKRTVLAHNGVLPIDAHPRKGDDRSDTRILADDLLPGRYAKLDRRSTRKSLATWAGKGNKLLILTVNPEYRRNAYLVNAGAGEWDQASGIWHSNSSWAYSPTWYSKSWGKVVDRSADLDPYRPTYDDEGREICLLCGTGTLSEWTRYCNNQMCNSCGDCFEWIEDCQCYSSYLSQREKLGGGALDVVADTTNAVTNALALGWSHE